MADERATLAFTHHGHVARLELAAPKANILDEGMVGSLCRHLDSLAGRRDLKAIVLGAQGPHFCFGASIEEHLPGAIGGALLRLRELLEKMLETPAPTIVAIRGQCLGGGLELALAGDLIVAEESASLGCPEIKLGVFPPAAAALLPPRLGSGPASRLVLTGESVDGNEAASMGLVSELAVDGELDATVDELLGRSFLPRSASALRHTCLASRRALRRAVQHDLPELESLYLNELMAEADPVEGIRAFLEKRKPRWEADRVEP
jgi:cyclohexa-1,5-dienecarbonyl-CoA hydratase